MWGWLREGILHHPDAASLNGLPLVASLSTDNTHDSQVPKPMVLGHQTRHDPHRSRHFKPQHSMPTRPTTPRIAPKGIE